ncbi:LAME_0H21132g1_1 [Lachancea meyersii CBS 8951]|uniref:LAME_0H21132g1_1 n=1 Tax=Lachancea meyersii CBS 8951 TaxID=1266667 RepID=A0A1G4KJP1_9SACH|nr:LAME_0H21132g1_1 [Lachancea meyersii CBS 8951]
MPSQEHFAIERFMDEYEENVDFNVAETCCHSLTLNELHKLCDEKFELNYDKRLTYGSICGSPELRSLIAKIHSSQNVQLTKENVLITNGAIAANFLVSYALAGPGDHVICVAPTYQQLSSVPRMFGADVDILCLKEVDGYLPHIAELTAMIKPNTKLIVLNNPNNPLGSVIPTDLLEKIATVADDRNITVLCDEVYSPLFHSCGQPKSFVQLSARGIVTGSMSKAYSAAGVRLGWIVSRDTKFLEQAASRRDYNTISVSMVDDEIAHYILRNRDAVLKRNYTLCTENLATLKDFVKSSNGKFSFVHEPEGGSVCLIRVSGIEDTEAFARSLATHYKVLFAPVEVFWHSRHTSGWIRELNPRAHKGFGAFE